MIGGFCFMRSVLVINPFVVCSFFLKQYTIQRLVKRSRLRPGRRVNNKREKDREKKGVAGFTRFDFTT